MPILGLGFYTFLIPIPCLILWLVNGISQVVGRLLNRALEASEDADAHPGRHFVNNILDTLVGGCPMPIAHPRVSFGQVVGWEGSSES